MTQDFEAKRTPSRHPKLYLVDGDIILLAEDELYKVHRDILARHSTTFLGKLAPLQADGIQEGLTDETPVKLSETSSVAFELLLSILYRLPRGVPDYSADTWLSLLTLAQRWDFKDVEELAVGQLDIIVKNPVDRILISQKWNVRPDWISEGTLELCLREEAITLEEGERIIKEVAPANFAHLIWKIVKAKKVVRDHKRQDYPASDLPILVSEVFGLPLSEHWPAYT